MASLIQDFSSLGVSTQKSLPFNPCGDLSWLQKAMGDVPKYLFRICSPRSSGSTDEIWVRSADAESDSINQSIDIFSRSDRGAVATMLNRHLRWQGGPGLEDNMVSWTSSLLFALQYIFYRHYNCQDRSDLSAIDLYVVDTTLFMAGTFIEDRHLMKAFAPYNADLRNLAQIRQSKHKDFNGSFYFGEYLSQGTLCIHGKSQRVSAAAMVSHGLYSLRPELADVLESKRTPWANKVIALREIYHDDDRSSVKESAVRAAFDIAALFGGPWRLPMGIYLVALASTRDDEPRVLSAFLTEFEGCSYY